jgi:hypothetical protein
MNLSVNDDNEVKISAAGGIEALATVMDTHQARALLQENVCVTLHNLAINARLRGRIKAVVTVWSFQARRQRQRYHQKATRQARVGQGEQRQLCNVE